MSPDEFAAFSVADALDHPEFSPRLRDLIDRIDASGPDITIRECAVALGADPVEWAHRLCGEMIIAEVRRIAEAEAARKGLN